MDGMWWRLAMQAEQEEERDIYEDRFVFVDHFCASRQWDAHNLSWAQICEIRSQVEWANPPQSDTQLKSVVRRKGQDLFVYEDGEFCCVCQAVEDLERWGFGDPSSPLEFTICKPCHEGGAFTEWLSGEFERTMIVHDENRKLPDGRWTTNKYDPENP